MKMDEEKLREYLKPEICYDFRKVRGAVLLHTWHLFETERIPFREAIKRAWAKVKEICREKGAYI